MAQVRARLSGVTKVFESGNGRVHALGPLDLDLGAGEFVTIVGPSGCGKTTLLETFGALDQQTRLLMGDELLRLWRETHATVLLITHAIDEAVMLADRVGVMSARPGRFIELIETGWPASRSSAIVAEEAFGKLTA